MKNAEIDITVPLFSKRGNPPAITYPTNREGSSRSSLSLNLPQIPLSQRWRAGAVGTLLVIAAAGGWSIHQEASASSNSSTHSVSSGLNSGESSSAMARATITEPTPTESPFTFNFPDSTEGRILIPQEMGGIAKDALAGSYTVNEVAQRTQAQTFREAVFLQKILKKGGVFPESPTKIDIGERSYDITEPTTRTIAEAILRLMISDKSYTDKDIDNIAQLEGKIVFVDTKQVINIQPLDLASLSSTLGGLAQNNIEHPITWATAPAGASPSYDLAKGILYFDNSDPIGSLAPYFKAVHPSFYDEFIKTVNSFPSPSGEGLSTNSQPGKGEKPEYDERFTFMVRSYLGNGEDLRDMIDYAYLKGDQKTASFLKAQYDLFKSFFGYETSQDGQKTELFNPQIGQVVEVSGPGSEKGVYLKDAPVTNKNPQWETAKEGEEAKIISGSTQVIYEKPLNNEPKELYPQAMKYVKVEVGYLDKGKWTSYNVNGKPEEGWMPLQYLQPLTSPQKG